MKDIVFEVLQESMKKSKRAKKIEVKMLVKDRYNLSKMKFVREISRLTSEND